MRANPTPPAVAVAVIALRYDPRHRGFELRVDSCRVQRQLRQRHLRLLLPERAAADFTGSAVVVQQLRTGPGRWRTLDRPIPIDLTAGAQQGGANAD